MAGTADTMTDTLVQCIKREDQRQTHRRQLEGLLMDGSIRPDLAELRLRVGIALRAFTQYYDGLPRTLRALACQKLMLTETGLVEAMNAPDVLTRGLQETGRFSSSTAYVFRALYNRPEGLSRTALLNLCRPAIGGTADLDVALAPLLEARIVKHRRLRECGAPGRRWYQVVRVGIG